VRQHYSLQFTEANSSCKESVANGNLSRNESDTWSGEGEEVKVGIGSIRIASEGHSRILARVEGLEFSR